MHVAYACTCSGSPHNVIHSASTQTCIQACTAKGVQNSPDLNDWEEGEDSVEIALAHDGEGGGGTGSGAAILQRQL